MTIMRSKFKPLPLGAALILLGLPHCTVENNNTLVILENGIGESSGSSCLFAPDPSAVRASGSLDVKRGHGYVMAPVVENRMRLEERNTVAIRAFDIEIKAVCDGDDSDCLEVADTVDGTIRVPGAGSIEPSTTQSIPTEAIPRSISQALADSGVLRGGPQTLRLHLRAVGGRNVDEEIESGTFEYYVTVCDGCLVRGLDPPAACPGGTGEGYCGRAQDSTILDCCVSGQQTFCPASSAPTAP